MWTKRGKARLILISSTNTNCENMAYRSFRSEKCSARGVRKVTTGITGLWQLAGLLACLRLACLLEASIARAAGQRCARTWRAYAKHSARHACANYHEILGNEHLTKMSCVRSRILRALAAWLAWKALGSLVQAWA